MKRPSVIDEADFHRVLGRSVRNARLAESMTQSELGKAIGLSRPSVANLEAGRQVIAAVTLVRIMDRLDVLLPYVDPPSGETDYPRCAPT